MRKVLTAFFLLACTIFVFIQMRPSGKKLRTGQTKYGILNLEFAYNASQTSNVLNAWQGEEKITAARTNTYIDYGLLFFYSIFLFYSCKNLSKNFSGKLYNIGRWLARAALVAGALDIIENAGMLITLGGNSSALLAVITAICALVKWLLALLAFLYVIFISPVALYLFIKSKKRKALNRLSL